MDISGVCNYCQNYKKLIKSHIIPRQFYNKVTDGECSQGTLLKESVPNLFSTENKSKQYQSGLIANNILCGECDGLLGVWDDYAQNILLDDYIWSYQPTSPAKIRAIKDIDYSQVKLFFMSLLWRSFLAKDFSFSRQYNNATRQLEDVGKFFENVDLDEQWSVKLRDMLIQKQPGGVDDFSVFITKYCSIEALSLKPPFKWQLPKNSGIDCYRFMVYGYDFCIKVDSKPFPNPFRELSISPNQSLKIVVLKEYKNYADDLTIVSNLQK
jgi:hypothetical protein